jgi:hypothetical protein
VTRPFEWPLTWRLLALIQAVAAADTSLAIQRPIA